jgi:hypothetical protein
MHYDSEDSEVALTFALQRRLIDLMRQAFPDDIFNWNDRFRATIETPNTVRFFPKESAHKGTSASSAIIERIIDTVVALPTPPWVDSKQRVCLCFKWEVKEMQSEWWEEFTKLL